ncbi:hypothetical protein LTR86_010656 [Recurvomyces mirabilis]|nr:hypothetical protein LTR86_010656 [Recurvomyces mirabilis]
MAQSSQILELLNTAVADQDGYQTRVTELEGVIAMSTAELAVAKTAVEDCQRECLNLTQALQTSFRETTTAPAEGQLLGIRTLPMHSASNTTLAFAPESATSSSSASDTYSQARGRSTKVPSSDDNKDSHIPATEDKKRRNPQSSYPEMIHDQYQCVVLLNGGLCGLHLHVVQVHHLTSSPKQTSKETLALCTKRVVSDRDAELMMNGEDPKDVAIDRFLMVGRQLVHLDSKVVDSAVAETAAIGTHTAAEGGATTPGAAPTLTAPFRAGLQIATADKRGQSDVSMNDDSDDEHQAMREGKRRRSCAASKFRSYGASNQDRTYFVEDDEEA